MKLKKISKSCHFSVYGINNKKLKINSLLGLSNTVKIKKLDFKTKTQFMFLLKQIFFCEKRFFNRHKMGINFSTKITSFKGYKKNFH